MARKHSIACIGFITRSDAAYIAGLIDGEGSIYVMRHTGKNGTTFYPAISISMTSRPVLDWLADLLCVSVSTVSRTPAKWRDQFMVRIHGKKAVALAARIGPFLKVKHEQALLIAEFPGDQRRAPGKLISADVQDRRSKMREIVNGLNSRGVEQEGRQA